MYTFFQHTLCFVKYITVYVYMSYTCGKQQYEFPCLFSSTNETSRKIRGSVTDTGEEIWSVFDFINAVCEKDRNDSYGRVTYYRLAKEDSPFHQELLSRQKYMKLSGRGSWP